MTERGGEKPGALEEARAEAEYYRRMAEEAGVRRLREAESLSRLLERAQEAERLLQRAHDELELRVAARTAELTAANVHLSEVAAERARAEAALRASEAVFRSFMGHFPGLAYIKEADTACVFASEGFRTYLGLDPEALVGKTNAECFPEPFASEITRDDLRVLATGRAEHIDEEFGGRRWITHKFVIRKTAGPPRLGGLTLDVTEARRSEEERRRLERQMEQAQRIESLGVLAGGIAHDFNNLLTSILANVGLLRAEVGEGALARDCLEDVRTASEAAAGLCRQMLAYAGRAPFAPEPIAIGQLVREMAQLLRSSVSRKLPLELRLAEDPPLVRGDPTQLRQVVMNLVINAAEAIGEADGSIVLTTAMVQAGPERLRGAVLGELLRPGDYVLLEVADTGCGMDAETQRRIFEPFFTSKFAGRGLGLSAVLGIVRQLGGAIELESAPGHGTRFGVLLPVMAADAPPDRPAPAVERWTGEGLVLVVDDDPTVRRAMGRLLAKLGFDALEAEGGLVAVELFRRHAGEIRAVLLDLTMPHLDGVETLRALRGVDPHVYVVVASGHAHDDVVARFRDDPPEGILQKPFRTAELAAHLRAALDRAKRPAPREG